MHILYFKYIGIQVKKVFTQYVDFVFYYVKMPLIYIYHILEPLNHCFLYYPNAYKVLTIYLYQSESHFVLSAQDIMRFALLHILYLSNLSICTFVLSVFQHAKRAANFNICIRYLNLFSSFYIQTNLIYYLFEVHLWTVL